MMGQMEKIMLEINGEAREIPPVSTVRELLDFLGIAQGHVAVEVNRKIVRRTEWERSPICDRDHVEIVQFVGGG